MFQFYDKNPPELLGNMQIGGKCPHCKEASRFSLGTHPEFARVHQLGATELVVNYICELCLRAIPILWHIRGWNGIQPTVESPELVISSIEDFNFDHVPDAARKEIEEALSCLSVSAYNGFAALCRRAVQAICVDLGAEGSTRVEQQIRDMSDLVELDPEWKDLVSQVMLIGHDGAHPHLPEVDAERATLLLSLLKDLTYELYTRPGNVKKAMELRQQAIQRKKENDSS